MTQKDFENAANYWKQKERTEMPKEQLKEKIEAYIQANNTCALATGAGNFIRCTPLEYSYHDEKFWIFRKAERSLPALQKRKCLPCHL